MIRVAMLGVVLGVASCGDTGQCEGPACLTGTGGGSGGTGGGMQMSVDCAPACNTKAQQCGAPAAGAAQFCNDWCGKNPNAAQVACLQSSDCVTLMQPNPCGVGGTGGGSGGGSGGGAAGGHGGGSSGGAGGGNAFACAGQTCKSSSACCSQYPYCSPDSSGCGLQCKANGQSCFFDSDCCNMACDRGTNTCTTCKGGGSACGNGNTVACCSGGCANNTRATCKGPGEICLVNADCCDGLYCNATKCFRKLRDGGIP